MRLVGQADVEAAAEPGRDLVDRIGRIRVEDVLVGQVLDAEAGLQLGRQLLREVERPPGLGEVRPR
jgi:hypothetical protein